MATLAKREYLLPKWVAVTPKSPAALKAKAELDAALVKAGEAKAKLDKIIQSAVTVPAGGLFVLSYRFNKLSYNFAKDDGKEKSVAGALEI